MADKLKSADELKPLKITCKSTDCTNNLHCFQLTEKMRANGPHGRCRSCGVELIDWPRVHRRDLNEISYTFTSLKLEMIRHHFWHIPLSDKAVKFAINKGPLLRSATEKQIRSSVGSEKPYHDGFQTPRETSPRANAIHYAQHATASCCRKCIEEWHGIIPGRALTELEIIYLTELSMRYMEERIPELNKTLP